MAQQGPIAFRLAIRHAVKRRGGELYRGAIRTLNNLTRSHVHDRLLEYSPQQRVQ